MDAKNPPNDGPTIIPLQPRPIAVDVVYITNAAGTSTAIGRDWRPGDVANCHLCPAEKCSARGRDHCTVGVAEFVPYELAALFSLVGREWQGGAGRRVDGGRH